PAARGWRRAAGGSSRCSRDCGCGWATRWRGWRSAWLAWSATTDELHPPVLQGGDDRQAVDAAGIFHFPPQAALDHHRPDPALEQRVGQARVPVELARGARCIRQVDVFHPFGEMIDEAAGAVEIFVVEVVARPRAEDQHRLARVPLED